jgi:predicted RNA-binding Zn-ribbon protein involved in translation (DUF1610 family)
MSPYRKAQEIELYKPVEMVSYKLHKYTWQEYQYTYHDKIRKYNAWTCPKCGTARDVVYINNIYCHGRRKFKFLWFQFGKKICPHTKEHLHIYCPSCGADILLSTYENNKEEIITETQ